MKLTSEQWKKGPLLVSGVYKVGPDPAISRAKKSEVGAQITSGKPIYFRPFIGVN